ncbi:unnamed protein product [Closterium sp. Yama58-4]|nr:unnamed protein product [Closterium sp. Yama58-4]
MLGNGPDQIHACEPFDVAEREVGLEDVVTDLVRGALFVVSFEAVAGLAGDVSHRVDDDAGTLTDMLAAPAVTPRAPLKDRSVNAETPNVANLGSKVSTQTWNEIDAEANARIEAMRESFREKARVIKEQTEAQINSLPEEVAQMPVEEYLKLKKLSLEELLIIQQISTSQ